ncbi:hypothetical protein B0H19DRAFT_1277751 [Mycena capillaripes]|nr:hypothetical protein B0H19DRAFT_1277751 [Mycena capillaripes]
MLSNVHSLHSSLPSPHVVLQQQCWDPYPRGTFYSAAGDINVQENQQLTTLRSFTLVPDRALEHPVDNPHPPLLLREGRCRAGRFLPYDMTQAETSGVRFRTGASLDVQRTIHLDIAVYAGGYAPPGHSGPPFMDPPAVLDFSLRTLIREISIRDIGYHAPNSSQIR